jgi:hypothetical protein
VAEGEELGSNLLHVGQRGGEQPYGGWSLPPCAIVTMTDRYDKRLVDRKKSVPCNHLRFRKEALGAFSLRRTYALHRKTLYYADEPTIR